MGDRLRHLVAIGALVGALAIAGWQSQNPFRSTSLDFVARYSAAEVVLDGGSPYDEPTLLAQEQENGYPYDHAFRVYDLPPAQVVLAPLGLLPLKAASMLLVALSLGGVALLARRLTSGRAWLVTAVAAVGVLTTSASRQTLAIGQTDLFALGLVLLLASAQPVAAVVKPQSTAVLAIGIFLRHGEPWVRRLGLAVLGGIAVLVGTWLVAPQLHWDDAFDSLEGRYTDPLAPAVAVLAGAALVVLTVGLVRARRDRRDVPIVPVAAAAASILVLTGGWNLYWHLGLVVAAGALLAPVLLGELRLPTAELVVLAGTTTMLLGDAANDMNRSTTYQAWVPVTAVALLGVALVAARLVPWWLPIPCVLLNAALTLTEMARPDRHVVPMVAAVALLWLLFRVDEPERVPLIA